MIQLCDPETELVHAADMTSFTQTIYNLPVLVIGSKTICLTVCGLSVERLLPMDRIGPRSMAWDSCAECEGA